MTAMAKSMPGVLGADDAPLLKFLELAPLPSFIIDLECKVTYCNASGHQLLGLDPAICQGLDLFERVHPDERPLARAQAEALLSGETRSLSAERRYLHSAGHYVWVTAAVTVIRSTGGEPRFFSLQAVDIDEHKRAEEALIASEEKWAFALESAGQGVWEADIANDKVHYSPSWKKLRGYEPDEFVPSDRASWFSRLHPQDQRAVENALTKQRADRSAPMQFEYRERHKAGHYIWIQSRGAAIAFRGDGQPTRMVGTDTDISVLKSAERRSQDLATRLGVALKVSRIGVFEADLETGDLFYDERLREIFGISQDKSVLSAEDFEQALCPEDLEETVSKIDQAVRSQGVFNGRYRIRRPDGSIRTLMAHATYLENDAGAPRFVGANWDITEEVELADSLKAANALAGTRYRELELAKTNIENLALHDPLTGLPNRRYLDESLAKHVSSGVGYYALLHIDLDQFKQVNDTLGHAAGDLVLRSAANTLSSIADKNRFVARVGGDEFTIACLNSPSTDYLSSLGQEIVDRLKQPIDYKGHACRVGASVGIASCKSERLSPQRLLISADAALYRAKANGRNRYEFFTDELKAEIELTKQTADDLIKAIRKKQFIPYYQPVVDAQTFSVVSVEALARWIHPTQGVLSPARFLKTAENLNLVAQIDQAILEQAAKDITKWSDLDLPIQSVSVNVSFARLKDKNLLKIVSDLNLPAGAIHFELLESIFLDDDNDEFQFNIDGLKDLGVGLDIDDFGTGHTSFLSLFRLHPRRLKIDRQLIAPITSNLDNLKIVRSVIDIGKTLGIDVVAEGVETMEHARLLRRMGCDFLQGYVFAKPMCEAELQQWICQNTDVSSDLSAVSAAG